MRGIYKTFLGMAILVYVGYGIFLFIKQDSIIYLPEYAPGSLSECARASHLTYINEGPVQGLLYPKSTSSLIVIFPGNATNACERDLYPIALYNNPASIFVVSYPGYMGSSEKASNKSILAEVDATAKWIASQHYAVTGIIGESIGVGPASYLAANSPAPLALIGPFPSLSSLAQHIYWMYPTNLLIRNDYDVTAWAAKATRVFLMVGDKDETIPPKFGELLFSKLPQGTTHIKHYPSYDHTELINSGAVAQDIHEFLK